MIHHFSEDSIHDFAGKKLQKRSWMNHLMPTSESNPTQILTKFNYNCGEHYLIPHV